MIYSIKGKVLYKNENFVVIEAGGIGFKIFVLDKLLKNINLLENIFLFIYFYMRENIIELYGFQDLKELRFFELLNSVAGVGPKSAMAILEKNDIKTLSSAIKNDKIEFLTRASGIGKKTAERIVLELKNKIQPSWIGEIKEDKDLNLNLEIIEALVGLGYSKKEAQKAVQSLEDKFSSFEEGFKKALRFLNKK